MTKTELISKVSEKTEYSQKETGEILNSIIDTITESLKNEEKVIITGFGTFETRNKAARNCRNPKTGETILVEALKEEVK